MLLFYEYKRDHHPGDFMFLKAILFKYPAEDLVIIKDDWQKIVEKIRAGRAHELSEGDTFYLGACTKGATAATSLRQQPFSNIPAKQRAYCLKNKYMTYLVRKFVFGEAQDEHIIKSVSELAGKSFESYVTSKLEAYKGKSVEELKQIFEFVYKCTASMAVCTNENKENPLFVLIFQPILTTYEVQLLFAVIMMIMFFYKAACDMGNYYNSY